MPWNCVDLSCGYGCRFILMARAKVACTSSVQRRRTFDGKTRGNKVMDCWKQNPASGRCSKVSHWELCHWQERSSVMGGGLRLLRLWWPGAYSVETRSQHGVMVLSVNRADENAALRIKRVKSSQLSYEENIFSDLEGGEVILGNGEYNYFDDCLFVANQGLTPNIGDPVLLRSGKSFLQRKDDGIVYGISRGDIIASWQPFGS